MPLSRDDTSAIGARGGREEETRGFMSDDEEGSDKVTASTRAFEKIDAQAFPGPGRGATRSEAAASDCLGGPSPGSVEAYQPMIDLVVRHQRAHSERRASMMKYQQSVEKEKDRHV
jgi:hypothetical protein